jgi:hypothetical protein
MRKVKTAVARPRPPTMLVLPAWRRLVPEYQRYFGALLDPARGTAITTSGLGPAGWGASQPAIEIVLGDGTVMLPRSELLQRADLAERPAA